MDATVLHRFLRVTRANLTFAGDTCRIVSLTEMVPSASGVPLHELVSDVCPLYYRDRRGIISGLEDGFFLTPFKQTLARLPTSAKFRESHFGEVVGALFAEHVLGLRLLYSKLSMVTAENENPKKMDLVMCDIRLDPVELVLGEVKSSPKSVVPANHDRSCFADLFTSLRNYDETDLDFDLAAARDRLGSFRPDELGRIKAALLPYAAPPVRYAGIAVIDTATKCMSEMGVLAKRRSPKEFDVDVVCVENYAQTADKVFARLSSILGAICSP